MTVQYKIIASLIVTALLTIGIVLGTQQILAWRSAASVGQQRGQVLVGATEGIQQGQVLDAEQTARDTGLEQGRQQFNDTLNEAKRNEPETARRATNSVPASVRNAFHERRRARERLGCAGSQCAKDDTSDAATER